MGQKDDFIKALPNGYRLGQQLYRAVQKGMGISEDQDFPDFMYEVYNGEWGTDKGREWAQNHTPGQKVVNYTKLSKIRNEQEVPKKVMVDKEKFYKELKKERSKFQDDYGDKADSIMHATAMNMAKRKHGIN